MENYELFISVMEQMAEIERKADFLSILRSLVDGRLNIDNIARHLLLDIGQFHIHYKVNSMR